MQTVCEKKHKISGLKNPHKNVYKGGIHLYIPVPTNGSLGLPKLQCLYPKKHLDAAFVSGI